MSGLQAVKLAGGIMPPALLGRIQAGEVANPSLTPASYHLAAHESVRDAAARSWSYLRGAYAAWQEADAARIPGSPGTGLARDRWLLPLLRELGYGNVPALSHGYDIDDTHYPISHAREHIPVHLLGPDAELDRRNPGMLGAARAPQAMVQEFLNRSDEHLWAVLSNGLRLRLLRDSTSLAGSAYIEFDLDAIFERRAVLRVPPPVPGRALLPAGEALRGRRLPGRLLDGGLARRVRRRRHPRPGQAARRRRSRDRRPGHRVPAPPRQPLAGHRPARRETCPTATTTAPCSAWSTACCSRSSPRTATPCSTPPPPPKPAPGTPTTSPPPACAGCPTSAAADPTPTCGRPNG